MPRDEGPEISTAPAVEPVADRDAVALVRHPPEGFEVCLSPGPASEERVTLAFDVDRHGAVENARVVEATDRCFIPSAMEAVKGWRFSPAMRNGETVPDLGKRSVIVYEIGGSEGASAE